MKKAHMRVHFQSYRHLNVKRFKQLYCAYRFLIFLFFISFYNYKASSTVVVISHIHFNS